MSRELIVSGPAGDPRVTEQVRTIEADPAGAEERRLTVHAREAAAFVVELSVNGAVQARWDNQVGLDELWARVDALPARRRELRQAGAQDRRAEPV